uniref:Uncharacterized protein n=1 Tax=Aegilops tauschii subsp. strangulata TaxID=200361 RepID=A0A452XHG1_AEGTS
MKQPAELLRMARPVLQNLCVALWPTEAFPTSLFGLLMRLRGAVSRANSWRRSACFEGARRAYACVKMHFWKVNAVTVATGPPADKLRTAEQFYTEVEGARITEAMCPKDTLYY